MDNMAYFIESLVVLNLFVTIHCDVTASIFQQTANKRYANISQTREVLSVLSCSKLCHDERNWCKIFNYHTTDQLCELGELTPGNNVLTESRTGWEMYTNAADDCKSSPCINSGTCTDHIGYYECSCADGWGGLNCDTITGCISGWEKFENTCYYFDTTARSQQDAQENCGNIIPLAHLVDINSSDEQDFIVSLIVASNTNSAVFTGGKYDVSNGQYFWTEGQSFSDGFSIWGKNEPTTLSEECVVLWPGFNYHWADYSCNVLLLSLCEYDIPIMYSSNDN